MRNDISRSVRRQARICPQRLNRYGRRQSTGAAPCAASSSFARLNGRDPKKPFAADSGLGCALSIAGVFVGLLSGVTAVSLLGTGAVIACGAGWMWRTGGVEPA